MVYSRYIYGCGPYVYRSEREGNHVHSVYLGKGFGGLYHPVYTTFGDNEHKTGKDLNKPSSDYKTGKDKMNYQEIKNWNKLSKEDQEMFAVQIKYKEDCKDEEGVKRVIAYIESLKTFEK